MSHSKSPATLIRSSSPAITEIAAGIKHVNESLILEIAGRAIDRKDVIRLYVGESDQPTPEYIVQAATDAMRAGHTRYTMSRGITPLREAIARYHSTLYQVAVNPDRVTVSVGGMQALSQTFTAILNLGDEVLVPVPIWPNAFEAVKIAGGTPIGVPLRCTTQAGWHLDLDDLYERVNDKTRVIFINSPGNPTGWVMTQGQMQQLLAFARERGIWIVSDEVYGRLIYDRDGPAPSFIPLIELEDRVVVVNTFSKNWSMTGWRIGWIIAPPSLGKMFDDLMQYSTTCATTFVQHAAVTAMNEGDETVRSMVSQCKIGRDIVCDRLEQVAGIRMFRPTGAFYLFFSVDGLNDSRQFAFDLLDKSNVALAPGAAFGVEGEGWLRLCFGVSHGALTTAADRIAAYISDEFKP